MKMKEFIRQNREELDRCIDRVNPEDNRSDRERELWIRNDERLYHWARKEGVRI